MRGGFVPQEYAINYEPLFEPLEQMDIQGLIDEVDVPWYNQTLIQVGDVLVRLGVMKGEFHWHTPRSRTSSFWSWTVCSASNWRDAETVELGPRQAFTVPAGILHRPVVPVRSVVLMIEKAGVVPTGD
jgi:hypothetical protein